MSADSTAHFRATATNLRAFGPYVAPKLLIIDEFGIWPYVREAATALFSIGRSHHRSEAKRQNELAGWVNCNPAIVGQK